MTPALRVVTIGHRFPDATIEAAVLGPLGIETAWLGPLAREAALAAAVDAQGVLLGTGFALDADAIRRLSRCRAIVRYGVGVDNVDVASAAQRGIVVCNVPDYSIEEVANHTIALLMVFARRLDVWPTALRAGQWGTALPTVRLRRLSQTTLGVVGAGRIGQAVIARASAIWGQVLASDPVVEAERLKPLGAQKVPLDTLLAESDFITLHVPSASGTKGMLGAREFRLMKHGAVLVNCSRGDIVEEAALAAALAEGRLAGAGLDVFAAEPPPLDGLVAMPQVWPTPHIAWLSAESIVDLRTRAAEEAGRVLTGERPRYSVT